MINTKNWCNSNLLVKFNFFVTAILQFAKENDNLMVENKEMHVTNQCNHME